MIVDSHAHLVPPELIAAIRSERARFPGVRVGRLCSGHVTRYANAKIVAPMGAAGLPFVLGRLRRNAEITPGVADPVEAIGRLYVDTILHDARVLQFVIAMLGTERLMMGSDSPFPIGDLEPMKIVAAAGLSADQAAVVNGGLAKKVFGIK